MPVDAPAPATVSEARWLYAAAKADVRVDQVTGTFITADMYEVAGDRFTVEADVNEVLDAHGPGVDAVQVWATVDGEPAVISGYSAFHEVELPEGYEAR